jgi:hypothetical protein
MSNQSRYMGSSLLNEPTDTGGANTRNWVESMRGMTLLYSNGCLPIVGNQNINPPHLEDFMSMLHAAVRKPEAKD